MGDIWRYCIALEIILALEMLDSGWAWHKRPSDPKSESSISRARIISRAMQYLHISNKRGFLTFFLLPFSNLRAYLIFMGQSSTSSSHFDLLHCTSFSSPPPHPRRGDLCHHWQAFTQA